MVVRCPSTLWKGTLVQFVYKMVCRVLLIIYIVFMYAMYTLEWVIWNNQWFKNNICTSNSRTWKYFTVMLRSINGRYMNRTNHPGTTIKDPLKYPIRGSYQKISQIWQTCQISKLISSFMALRLSKILGHHWHLFSKWAAELWLK